MSGVAEWITIKYLQPGAYIGIMLAVLGVPQLLSGIFDVRARRLDRQDNESSAERRHQENLEQRREELRLQEEQRREELRRQEERQEERRREERAREEERRLEEARRHQEIMAVLIAALNHGRNQVDVQDQSEAISALQQTVADLEAEIAGLRHQNGNGGEGDSP